MVEEEASCVQEEQTETLDPAKCTPEQHAYTVQCTEDGHVLHWIRMEQHRWSDWQVEKEPDCEDPGELRTPVRSAAWCAGSGWPRWAICCSSNPRMSGIPLQCAGCAAAPCGEALQEMLSRRKKRPEDPGPRHRTPRSDNENMVKCGKL